MFGGIFKMPVVVEGQVQTHMRGAQKQSHGHEKGGPSLSSLMGAGYRHLTPLPLSGLANGHASG